MSLPVTPNIAPFQDAMNKAWDGLTEKEKAKFLMLRTIGDVYAETDRIQHEQGKKGLLRNLKQIDPYLLWLKQYSGVIEVFVQVNPQILALIWVGPIKILLQIASSYIEIYDQLLEVFSRIGRCLPQFQLIENMFRENDQVNNVLSLFYKEIIEFHMEAVRFFRISGLRAFFSFLWPRFQEKFSVILGNIESHKLLIDRQITLAYIQDAYAARDKALAEYDKIRIFQEQQQLESLERFLDPPLYDEELETLRGKCCLNTGDWLFKDLKYQRWEDGNWIDLAHRILWISGIPGAGKTYQCSTLIDHTRNLRFQSASSVLFAFLRHDTAHKRQKVAILHSLMFQLFHENRTLLPVILAAYTSESRKLRTSAEYLSGLLQDMINSVGSTYLIIDGLDECDESERQALLKILIDLSNNCSNLRLAISSRDEADISRILRNIAQVIPVHSANNRDIVVYVSAQLDELSREFRPSTPAADPGVEHEIKAFLDPIVSKSKDQTTWEEVQKAATTLPAGLDEAHAIPFYGRILSRIKEKLKPNERHQVRRIIAWLVSATRPLKLLEIDHALMIRDGDNCLEKKRKLHKDMIQLCGPFIENQGETITFVHFSAKESV
ncbi:hypothetical protein BDD12DRAFT_926090 [Trichophaea hybrida]|nr:hypothetical protein BDD12DRAFT_926090 [Trichophaea hybrida]